MKKLRKLLILPITLTMFFGSVLTVSAAEIKDLFDADYYAAKYADLSAAFGDDEAALYNHYITYGMKEGRDASSRFNVKSYRSRYGDLDITFGDDWAAYVDHYLTYGIKEGRDGGGEFDAASYANRYGDLKLVIGYDLKGLYNHYLEYGIDEQRNPISQSLLEERMAAEAARRAAASASVSTSSSADSSAGSSESSPEVKDGVYIIEGIEGGTAEETWDDGELVLFKYYDGNGTLIRQREMEYDAAGNRTTEKDYMIDPETGEFTGYELIEYNSDGEERARYVYGADGMLILWIENEFNSAKQCIKTTEYDANGKVITVREYIYDAAGNQTALKIYLVDPETGEFIEYLIDEGNRVSRYDMNNTLLNWTEYICDDSGNLTEAVNYGADGVMTDKVVYNSDGTSVQYWYDSDGNVVRENHGNNG